VGDFAVEDDRKPVRLRYASQEETPLDIVLLFELSKPMSSHLPALRSASEMALAELREGDRVAVLSFNEEVRLEQPISSDLKEVKRKLRIGLAFAAFSKRPSVLPAAVEAARYLSAQKGPRRRRVVLMFTGDAGFGLKNQNHTAVAKDLWQADVGLSAMVIPTAITRLTRDDNPFHFGPLLTLGFNLWDNIDDIAEQTGGEVVETNPALRQVIQRLRKRYKLYYDMPSGRPGQRRQIAVTLSPPAQARHPDARIVSRKGYVMPKVPVPE